MMKWYLTKHGRARSWTFGIAIYTFHTRYTFYTQNSTLAGYMLIWDYPSQGTVQR